MKILYVTNSELKVKELRNALRNNVDVMSVDSLFDLEYDVIFHDYCKDMNQKAKKRAQAIWKREKENYDYVIADEYGLYSEYAPDILGVESDTWWPGTSRDRCDALVNLFMNVKNRNICYKSVFVLINKKGDVKEFEGYLEGTLAKRVREKNGERYDSVFLTKEGKYLSYYDSEDIIKISARNEALKKLIDSLN